jgi:hypothetical protein
VHTWKHLCDILDAWHRNNSHGSFAAIGLSDDGLHGTTRPAARTGLSLLHLGFAELAKLVAESGRRANTLLPRVLAASREVAVGETHARAHGVDSMMFDLTTDVARATGRRVQSRRCGTVAPWSGAQYSVLLSSREGNKEAAARLGDMIALRDESQHQGGDARLAEDPAAGTGGRLCQPAYGIDSADRWKTNRLCFPLLRIGGAGTETGTRQ